VVTSDLSLVLAKRVGTYEGDYTYFFEEIDVTRISPSLFIMYSHYRLLLKERNEDISFFSLIYVLVLGVLVGGGVVKRDDPKIFVL